LTFRLPTLLAAAIVLLACSGATTAVPTCTQVIGFSQTLQWYQEAGVFESVVDDGRWQLLGRGGASIDQWQDPDYVGWSDPIFSPCAEASAAPDRVVLTVSGIYGADEDTWVAAIAPVIAVIEAKLPSATEILLQPVVGGPGHADCFLDGELVRASWQHAHIDNAIARLVGGQVNAGASPEVTTCDHYIDQTGHLTDVGGRAAGAAIGAFYAEGLATTTTTTHATTTSTTLPSSCETPDVECSLELLRELLAGLTCTTTCRCSRISTKIARVDERVAQASATTKGGRCRRMVRQAAAAARKIQLKAERAQDKACADPPPTLDALRGAATTLVTQTDALLGGAFCARP
jgi:hypothetical protein